MRRHVSSLLAVALGLTGLAAAGAPAVATTGPPAVAARGHAPGGTPADADARRALRHLRADADGAVRVHRDQDGSVDFVGTGARDAVRNPARTRSAGVLAAARQDLVRYGAALGVDDPADDLVLSGRHPSLSGGSLLRFDQSIDGVPVIGGQVVVSLDRAGRLSSLQASTSEAPAAAPALVGRASAADTARRVTARAHGLPATAPRVSGGDAWLFDPAALGAPAPDGARTVRRFEVTHGADVREQVLVDARTGRVLLHFNDVQEVLDRQVCDRGDRPVAEMPCTNPVRGEGEAPSGVADVNTAYDLSGEVSAFYQQIGGLDLTELIGRGSAGSRTLASTVRFCDRDLPARECPYENAFWNGTEMFYGRGYAGADDVVGHEMTHGVISRYSDLFYYFQSGAINESMADVMGEIIDHRNPSPGDSAGSWTIGEDLPIGAIRSLRSPPAFEQPDRMTSGLYDADPELRDSGGVHTNSGVGNKTAYLISQGGTFNGVRVTGIDAGDPRLTKTATLYLDVISSLASGSDYADLGRVLVQSCADLAGAGTGGFDSADCAGVASAVRATELADQPPAARTAGGVPARCPTGTVKKVLFDDETAAPGRELRTGALWTRAPRASFHGVPVETNATSGTGSWFGKDPDPTTGDPARSSLGFVTPLTVQRGVKTYLRFNHWYAFDYDPGSPRVYYDGGLVLVDDVRNAAGPQRTDRLPWLNGPGRTVVGAGERARGFGGLSNGWTASRVDLSSYAGRTIRPQFQVRGDADLSYEGWYLDDVTVYSCAPVLPGRPRALTVAGGIGTVRVGWQRPDYPGTGVAGYRVTAPGLPARTTAASTSAVRFGSLTLGRSYTFTVRALGRQGASGPGATVRAVGTRFRVAVARGGGGTTRVSGRLFDATSAGLPRRTVKVQRQRVDGGWGTLRRVRTSATGRLGVTVGGRSRAAYRLVLPGADRLLGSRSAARRL